MVGLHLPDLGLVHVHHHLDRLARQLVVRIPREGHVESCADDQHQVRVLESEVRPSRCDRSGTSREEWVGLGEKVHPQPGRQDGYLQGVERLPKLANHSSRPDAVAGYDHRPLGCSARRPSSSVT